jgi:hypothetical protein
MIVTSVGLSWSKNYGKSCYQDFEWLAEWLAEWLVEWSGGRVAHTVICASFRLFDVPHDCFWNTSLLNVVNCECTNAQSWVALNLG